MSDISSIIEKIQKLRALAGNNTNVNEASAAAALADRLLQEHRLQEIDIQGHTPTANDLDPMGEKEMHSRGRRSKWIEYVLGTLIEMYNCSWYTYKSQRFVGGKQSREVAYRVVGRQSDLQIVAYMFAYLSGEIERLGKIHCKGRGVGDSLAWYDGAAAGVRNTLLLEREEQEKLHPITSTALVALRNRSEEAEVWKENLLNNSEGKRHTAKSLKGAQGRWDAYLEGREVGSQIQTHKGVSGNTSTPKLDK